MVYKTRVSTRFLWGEISKIQEKPYDFQHFLGVWDLKSISIFSSGHEIPYNFQQEFPAIKTLCQTDKQAYHNFRDDKTFSCETNHNL